MANEATKADLAALEKKLNAKINSMEKETRDWAFESLEMLNQRDAALVKKINETQAWAKVQFDTLFAAVKELNK